VNCCNYFYFVKLSLVKFCFSNYFSTITFCVEIKLCIKTLYNKVEAVRRADPASRLTLVCGAVADADDRSAYAGGLRMEFVRNRHSCGDQ